LDLFDGTKVTPQDGTIQEEDSAKRLILGGGGDVLFYGEMIQKRADVLRVQAAGVDGAVKPDKSPDPSPVRIACMRAMMHAAA